jgi:hypothetical protein
LLLGIVASACGGKAAVPDDASLGDAAEDYACIQGGPCSRVSSECVFDGGDVSYPCLCDNVYGSASPQLECFDCYQGAPCGAEPSCTIGGADGGILFRSCTCVDGVFDCVDDLDGGTEASLEDAADGAPDDDAGGTGDDAGASACPGMYACCGLGPPSGGYSCEQDYGAAVCGATGWTCPSGGSPAPGCSMLCIETGDGG